MDDLLFCVTKEITKAVKPWLVDVPVKINIWIRPECQRRQFEIIKEARPSILFIQSDGGRNEREWEIINEHRRMYEEEIDWNCTVYRIYADTNCGMYTMMRRTREVIWQHVDRCIFTEDDYMPSVSYFRFCAELLERYKDDLRISCICGTNSFDTRQDCSSDYFFAQIGSTWGIACWKRTEDLYYDFDYKDDPYTMRMLKNITRHNRRGWKQIKAFTSGKPYNGHGAGIEYFLGMTRFSQHQLRIIPTRNLISNIGYGISSAHADELRAMTPEMRRMFNTKTYEMEFPLKHPKYVIDDIEYSEMIKRQLCIDRPIKSAMRKAYRLLLMIRYKGIGNTITKARKVIYREIEK